MNCEWCSRQLRPDEQGRYLGLELQSEELEERLGKWKGSTVPVGLTLANKFVNAVIVKDGPGIKLFLPACSGDCVSALEKAVWDDLDHLT